MERKTIGIGKWCDNHIGLLFIIPALIILFGLSLYPILFNVNMSLHKVNMINFRSGDWDFVGLKNYAKIFTDPLFLQSFLRTLLFMILTVVGQLLLGMVGALTLNTPLKGKGPLTITVLLPMMMTPIAVGLFWRMLLNNQWGIINYFLNVVGIDSIPWLADSRWAFISICSVQIWWGVSFVILVLLGGLTALSPEPFEAAEIDGATKFQSFRYITLPSLAPVISVVVMLRAIDAFREFDLIYTLTQGGPGASTRVLSLQVYLTSFESQQYSLGSAQAMVLTVITLVLASGMIKNINQE